ncbi:OmpH family outer membrane protein [Candidatus Dependentiae bacterium]
MKKLALGMLCCISLSSNVSCTINKKNPELVSIDSILLMQKSKEGKILAEKLQKDVDAFQNFAKNAQKEIVDYQQTVQKQAKALSKSALIEKGENLEKMRKTAERNLTDKETDLKRKIQREQAVLRNNQMTVVSEIFEEKKWGMLIDKNTPGVLFVANSIDKTDEVLKVVDEKYKKLIAKNIVEKENAKKSITKKVG